MTHSIRFRNRSLINGLFQIFYSHPFYGLCTFLIIICISLIIPLSFIWLIQYTFFNNNLFAIKSFVLCQILTIWSIIEICFFVYQYYLFVKIQHPTKRPHMTSRERDELVSYALKNIKNLPNTLSQWFMDCPFENIDRDSIIGWLAFAFYAKDDDELTDDEYREIRTFIETIEEKYQIKSSKKQSDENVFCMKHILDPVRVIFRPFIFYFVTDTLLNGILNRLIFYLRGYQYKTIGHLKFWTYANNSNELKEPIIFFHGIGAGLLMYQPFISYIHRKCSNHHRIIFISMKCISMRYPTINDIPNMSETSDSIRLIFDYYKIKQAIFIGHSYGTACLSWIVQKYPQYISRLIFLDPICFALFEPYVVYNFVYRNPYKLGHLYLYYFVCRELGISYVISRHFWWTQNNLFFEQIPTYSDKRILTYVLLSGRDCITNSNLIRESLINNNIEYYWAANLAHGGYMHDKRCWKKICEWIL